MPNTGKPSLACHRCRARRCDHTLPGCLRCAKIGTACPGYREQQDLLFRNQHSGSFSTNAQTSKRRARQTLEESWGKSNALTSATARNSQCPAATGTLSLVYYSDISATSPLPQHVVEQWHSHCVPIVLGQLLPSNDGRRIRYLEFITDVYRETTEGSCLSLATIAVAKMYISNRSLTPKNEAEQAKIYGVLLRATNAALHNPLEVTKDSTLITIWLLSVYEILLGSSNGLQHPAPAAWHVHTEGLASLLRIRGPEQFSTARGRHICFMIYHLIHVHCLVRNIACPTDTFEWFEQLQGSLSTEEALYFNVLLYLHTMTLLCERLFRLGRSPIDEDSVIQLVTALLAETASLQNEVDSFTASLSPELVAHLSVFIFNTLYAGLIKIYHQLCCLLDSLQFHPQFDSADMSLYRESCITTVHYLSAKIIGSLPLALKDGINPNCWLDCFRLIFPLTTVSWATYGLKEHRDVAIGSLQTIGQQLGIRFALDIRPPPGRFAPG